MGLIKGLNGIKVIANDFFVVGFSDTLEQATLNHDTNLATFLEYFEEGHLNLNINKIQLRLPQVPFVGYVAIPKGLQCDPQIVDIVKLSIELVPQSIQDELFKRLCQIREMR